jgi:hypothetical protein
MQNGLFTSASHLMYVIIFDRHAGDNINSHHEYGIFDIYNKKIYRKHWQCSDSKCAQQQSQQRATSGGGGGIGTNDIIIR